ncbi:MAG: TRAP transporter substrate-binding protein DctP [Deltaproteobacteria bacterium]|nr:TRAP transporter substrate-binding protein DctP [Deltaproteobacteria bacterium]
MGLDQKKKFLIKKTFIPFVLVILLIFITSIFQSVPAAEKTYKLKYAGGLGQGTALEVIPEWWGKELEKRTGGRVKVEYYFGEALGRQFDYPKLLRAGVCDYALLTTAIAEFKMLGVSMAPFLMANRAVNMEATMTLINRGLLKELEDFKVLFYEPTDPFYYFFKDKRVTKLEDLKGLKLRGLPGFGSALNNALGAVGIAMPFQDVYTALERGTLDGLSTTVEATQVMHLEEVLKYCLWEPLFGSGNIVAMTKKLWDSFPADIQLVMEQLNAEARHRFMDSIKTPAELKADLDKAGWIVTSLTPEEKARWEKASQGLLEGWIKENEAKGYPAAKIVEVINKVKDYYD